MKFPYSQKRIQKIVNNCEITDEEFSKLYEYYAFNTNEMPYGTMKARTGDPDQWILKELEKRVNNGKKR